jgi:hypothetical protein
MFISIVTREVYHGSGERDYLRKVARARAIFFLTRVPRQASTISRSASQSLNSSANSPVFSTQTALLATVASLTTELS